MRASCPAPLGRRGRSLPATGTGFSPPFIEASWSKLSCTCHEFLGSMQPPVPMRARGHQLTCFPQSIHILQGTRPSCKLEPVVPKKALQVLSYKDIRNTEWQKIIGLVGNFSTLRLDSASMPVWHSCLQRFECQVGGVVRKSPVAPWEPSAQEQRKRQQHFF